MEILIPGALPPATIAPELLSYVEKSCPALVECFISRRARILPLLPDDTGCTPLEALELLRRGYRADAPALTLGAGLGPLRAGVTLPHETVWIADLSSVTVGTTGAALVHPEALQITAQEADLLFEAVCGLWEGGPISALPLSPTRWRIWLNGQPELTSMSPQAMTGMAMADWWPQHESVRQWRKLLNEIQMAWHDHPVNQARVERGAPPINSLWLYGGARGWKSPDGTVMPQHYTGLSESYTSSDWARWIEALPALSTHIATTLRTAPQTTLTLLGQAHGIELSPLMRPWWRQLLPATKQNWKTWWNLPN